MDRIDVVQVMPHAYSIHNRSANASRWPCSLVPRPRSQAQKICGAPGRALADEGRRGEIRALLANLDKGG